LSINGFTNSSNAGIVFVTLKPFEERKTPDLSGFAIAGALNKKFAGIKEAFIAMFPPPPVQGIGTIGGFQAAESRIASGAAMRHSTIANQGNPGQGPRHAGTGRNILRLSGQRAAALTPTSTAPRRASSASR